VLGISQMKLQHIVVYATVPFLGDFELHWAVD